MAKHLGWPRMERGGRKRSGSVCEAGQKEWASVKPDKRSSGRTKGMGQYETGEKELRVNKKERARVKPDKRSTGPAKGMGQCETGQTISGPPFLIKLNVKD